MIKILFTTNSIRRGGKERQLFILAEQLLAAGIDVNIIALSYSENNYLGEYKFDNQRIHYLNQRSRINIYKSFSEYVNKFDPEFIISWDALTASYCYLLSKWHGFVFINASLRHGVRMFKTAHLTRSFLLWLSPYRISNSIAGMKANNLDPDSRRNFVLYNGVDSKFETRYSGDELMSARKNLIPDYDVACKVFIAVANFEPVKDYFTMLDALAKYRIRQPFYLLVLGDGPMKKQITDKVEQLGLTEHVKLLGRVTNVSSYLRISDLFIHSSRGEGISNAILEAMFCGLPVVASDVGGVPETVFPGSSALYPFKNSELLYRALIEIEHITQSFDPASQDYRRHLDKFSVKTMTERFIQILETIGNR